MNLSDLRTALQERREDFSQSSAKLNRRINQSYLDLCSRRKWGWLRRTYTTQTFPSETYTVSATQHTRRVGVTSTLPTGIIDLKTRPFGRRVKINGQSYRITSIEPGSGADNEFWNLDQTFIGASASYSATVYYDEVALPPGAERIVKALVIGDTSFDDRGASTGALGNTNLTPVSPAEMVVRDLGSTGRPSRYSAIRKEPIPAPLAPDLNDATPISTATGPCSGTSVHHYWLSHFDMKSGAESALSPSLRVRPSYAGSPNLEISTSLFGLPVRIYRSRDGDETPFRTSFAGVVELAQGAVLTNAVDSMLDRDLGPRAQDSSSCMYMTLWPAPSGSYQIHILYQLEAQKMVEDEDMPLFDATFHHLILDGAEALMLEAEDEQSRANQARQRFEVGVARMIANDRLDSSNTVVMGGRRRITGRPQSWYGSWDGTGP